MRPTFHQTINVLVQAYLKGALKHGSCAACAVGNLLGGYNKWRYLFLTPDYDKKTQLKAEEGEIVLFRNNHFAIIRLCELPEAIYDIHHANKVAANKVIEESGYTVDELARIEWAFESAPLIRDKNGYIDYDERMFQGLMAVVDVVADIYGVSLKQKEEAKLLFVNN